MKNLPLLVTLRQGLWFSWMTGCLNYPWQHTLEGLGALQSSIITTGFISGLAEGLNFSWFSNVHYQYTIPQSCYCSHLNLAQYVIPVSNLMGCYIQSSKPSSGVGPSPGIGGPKFPQHNTESWHTYPIHCCQTYR